MPRTLHTGRLALALLVAGYLASYLWNPHRFGLLDHLDLAIHEAGHPLFAPLGTFMGMAGGTLLQLIVPAAFVVYFWQTGQRWSAFVVVFWLAQSLFNVSRYAADARAQLLPLVGGEYVLHDWNWMLGRLGLLERDQQVAAAIRASGGALYLVALAGSVVGALDPARLDPRPDEQPALRPPPIEADARPTADTRRPVVTAARWREGE
ncbi:MAG: hypothetical protein WEB88_16985 [Gemmatimonadota bacterium]